MIIDFDKHPDGLVPAIVQDNETKNVLMLGYMNEQAFLKTNQTNLVTFFSRSKKRLWTKGEESGNVLNVINIKVDCDNDSLLLSVRPEGPTCHTGSDTCWNEKNEQNFGFINSLEQVIEDRFENLSAEKSYVSSLFADGINKIAQKVGEEAVETVIEALGSNDDLFLNESADLLFHYLILLRAKGFQIKDVVKILQERHSKKEQS